MSHTEGGGGAKIFHSVKEGGGRNKPYLIMRGGGTFNPVLRGGGATSLGPCPSPLLMNGP